MQKERKEIWKEKGNSPGLYKDVLCAITCASRSRCSDIGSELLQGLVAITPPVVVDVHALESRVWIQGQRTGRSVCVRLGVHGGRRVFVVAVLLHPP